MRRPLIIALTLMLLAGCKRAADSSGAVPSTDPGIVNSSWLGIPSAVNQVIVFLHEGTGWLLNKSEVSIKKSGAVRATKGSDEWLTDYQIAVHLGSETFETVATDVPCDKDGIPTEAAVDRLRVAVEDIKTKMQRLQN